MAIPTPLSLLEASVIVLEIHFGSQEYFSEGFCIYMELCFPWVELF